MSCAPQKSQDEDSPSGDPEREIFVFRFPRASDELRSSQPGAGAGLQAEVSFMFEFIRVLYW